MTVAQALRPPSRTLLLLEGRAVQELGAFMLLRHLLSILLLPCTVVVVVPYTLLHRAARVAAPGGSAVANWPQATVGAALFLGGFMLFAWTIGLFARQGRGTLAPWDPTKQLVATGPYRHVRNPMYVAVVAVILTKFSKSWSTRGSAVFWLNRLMPWSISLRASSFFPAFIRAWATCADAL